MFTNKNKLFLPIKDNYLSILLNISVFFILANYLFVNLKNKSWSESIPYIWVGLAIGSVIIVTYYLALNITYQVHNLFLIISLSLGLIYSFISPPGRIPDELSHWIRAYEISYGNIYSDVSILPVSITEFNFQSYDQTLKSLTQSLEPDIIGAASSGAAKLYSPIPYIPQSLGIFILRRLNCKPLYIFYIGRILCLLGYVLLVYFALKIAPFYKNVFLVLSLTPMALHQAASLSADAITNGLSFLLIAYCLNLSFGTKEKISRVDVAVLLTLSFSLALCKIVYLPLASLYLLIPTKKFKNLSSYWLIFFGIVFIAGVANLMWANTVSTFLINQSPPNTSPELQIEYIINQPLDYIAVMINGLYHRFPEYIFTFFGSRLNALDVTINTGVISIFLGLVLFAGLTDSVKEKSVSIVQKGLVATIVTIVGVLILTSLLIQFNEVGTQIIEGVQGRYFIPIAPLLLLILYNRRYSIIWEREISCLLLIPVVLCHLHAVLKIFIFHM